MDTQVVREDRHEGDDPSIGRVREEKNDQNRTNLPGKTILSFCYKTPECALAAESTNDNKKFRSEGHGLTLSERSGTRLFVSMNSGCPNVRPQLTSPSHCSDSLCVNGSNRRKSFQNGRRPICEVLRLMSFRRTNTASTLVKSNVIRLE